MVATTHGRVSRWGSEPCRCLGDEHQAEGMSKCKQGAKAGLARFCNRKEASMAGAN